MFLLLIDWASLFRHFWQSTSHKNAFCFGCCFQWIRVLLKPYFCRYATFVLWQNIEYACWRTKTFIRNLYSHEYIEAQWAHDTKIKSLLRQSDVATSFWRNGDIIAPCVHWEQFCLRCRSWQLIWSWQSKRTLNMRKCVCACMCLCVFICMYVIYVYIVTGILVV